MGWLVDQVTKLFNWLADKILRPVVKWVTDSINTLVTELKIAAAVASRQVEEWLKNDYFFVSAIIVLIVGIVYAPKIAAYLKALKAKILASALVKTVGDISSVIKLEQILINLQTINAIFKLFWPEYRKLMQTFSDALSGAAKLFGEGTGFLHAYLNLARSIAINTAAFLGLDPEAAEITAYQHMAEWSKKLDNRVARYMRDPGLMMTDLITDVIIPMSEENMVVQGALVSDVRSNSDQLKIQHGAVQGLSNSVDTFIRALPDEIQEVVDERWIPFRDDLQERLDFIEDEVFTKIDETIEIFELRVTRAEQIADVVADKIDDPLAILGTGFLYGDYYLADYQDMMRSLVDGSENQESDIFMDTLEAMPERIDLSGDIPEDLIETFPSMLFEPPGISGGPTTAKSNKRDWFVGEF